MKGIQGTSNIQDEKSSEEQPDRVIYWRNCCLVESDNSTSSWRKMPFLMLNKLNNSKIQTT